MTKVVKGKNDLETWCKQNNREDLLAEWDAELNRPLTPQDVSYGSNKNVVWKCAYGHSWKAALGNRTSGRGCPFCSPSKSSMPEQGIAFYLSQCCDISQREIIDGKEIDIYLPIYKVAIEYDGIYFHSKKKKSDDAKTAHIQSLGIDLIRVAEADNNNVSENIIQFDTDNMGANYEWALHQLFELLSTKTGNDGFTKLDVNIKRDRIKIRERYNYIEKQNSLAVMYPAIAAEWDTEKNGILKPEMFSHKSNEYAWWKCPLGHSWKDKINNRVNSRGCPFCSNHQLSIGFNDLRTKNPELAKEWNYEKNGSLSPNEVFSTSSKKVWWKCSQGHEWLASVNNRSKGNKCPYCSNKKVLPGYNDLTITFPEIAAEWNYAKNKGLKNARGEDISTPDKVTSSSGMKVWWICSKGHEWECAIENRTGNDSNHRTGCPICRYDKVAQKKSKPIICIETNQVYPSAKEAAKQIGVSSSSICNCCKGKTKTSGGYHWKYVE